MGTMEGARRPGSRMGKTVSFKAVRAIVRRDCSSLLRSYEKIVIASSPQAARIGVAAYILCFALLLALLPYGVYSMLLLGVFYLSTYLIHGHVSRNAGEVAALQQQQEEEEEEEDLSGRSAQGGDSADQTESSDPFLLSPLAYLHYCGYLINHSLKDLPNNQWMFAVGALSITPVLVCMVSPTRFVLFLIGLYALNYPSWKRYNIWISVEQYLVQFGHMHPRARRIAVRLEPDADEEAEAEIVDDEFRQALCSEIEALTCSSSDLDDEPGADDSYIVDDSLLGLSVPDADIDALSVEDQDATAAAARDEGDADPWDFNQTAELDDEFAYGLLFSRSSFDSSTTQTDGQCRAASATASTCAVTQSEGTADAQGDLAVRHIVTTAAPLQMITEGQGPRRQHPLISEGSVTSYTDTDETSSGSASASASDSMISPSLREQPVAVQSESEQSSSEMLSPREALSSCSVSPVQTVHSRHVGLSSSSGDAEIAEEIEKASVEARVEPVNPSADGPDNNGQQHASELDVANDGTSDGASSGSSSYGFEMVSVEEAMASPEDIDMAPQEPSPSQPASFSGGVASALAGSTSYLKSWIGSEEQ